MPDNIKLYDINDGLLGRQGSTYADIEERKAAETRRAQIEGREPDYENASAVAGTVLVTASQLLAAQGVHVPNLGDSDDKTAADQAMVEAIAATDASTIKAVAEVPGPESEESPEEPPAEEPAEETPAEDPFAGTPAE